MRKQIRVGDLFQDISKVPIKPQISGINSYSLSPTTWTDPITYEKVSGWVAEVETKDTHTAKAYVTNKGELQKFIKSVNLSLKELKEQQL